MDCVAVIVSLVLLLALHSEIRRPCFQRRMHRTRALRIAFGEQLMSSASLIVGQSTIATIVPLEADGTTANTGATITSANWSVSDPTIASLTSNSDFSASITALAPGTASVSVSAVVSDADGVSSTFSATGTLVVTAPAPQTGRTASIAINFSTPA